MLNLLWNCAVITFSVGALVFWIAQILPILPRPEPPKQPPLPLFILS
jgi:hypothetical protein